MITPRFSCSQTAESVIVTIYCPSVRASEVEIHVDETLFSVHVKPYFLRLNFSSRLLEDDQSSAQYDASSGYLTVILTKETKGDEFKDLDLLAKLLAPRQTEAMTKRPRIEVIGGENTQNDSDDNLTESLQRLSLEQQEFRQAAENDWQVPQDLPEHFPTFHTAVSKPYGFLDMHSGYFTHVSHVENEVNELGLDAETCPVDERRNRRLKHEESKWDEEHYMADYADDEYIQELISWKHPHASNTDECKYSEAENLTMLRLPRKEYLATPCQEHSLYLTLLTLLFSYAYETRTTQCDPTPESAWTMSMLIPAFSALDPPPYSSAKTQTTFGLFPPSEIASTLIPPYRRSLAFPLYRSFALAEACRADVGALLSKGRRTIVRCLLEMKNILDHHEVYYIYSKIWMDDFCLWVQAYASEETLRELSQSLKALKMDKNMIGWDLEELEAATREVQVRESDSDDESTGEAGPL